MHIRPILYIALVSTAILCAGCSAFDFEQKNLGVGQSPIFEPENGVIVGSVTAPFVMHYHESIVFRYRKLGGGDPVYGVVTSGMQHKNFLMKIPACGEGGIPKQCGRVFAISLPAGDYEIYRAEVIGRDYFQQIVPALFTVTKGIASYIGNLHAAYCAGLVRRTRGNILGADVSIRDEYERDVSVARAQHSELNPVVIEKRLLADFHWRWRVSWKSLFDSGDGPYDWGGCSQ